MSSNGFWQAVDLMILLVGVYGLYAAWVLKNKGKIIKLFLTFKDTDVNTCKDLQGFANEMSPKLGTFSGTLLAYGMVSVLNYYVIDIHTLYWMMMVVFLIVLFWYGMAIKKALNQYF